MSDCKDTAQGAGKGPWKAVKLVLDSSMLFRMVHGETVIIEHRSLPPDAMLIEVKQNGTDVELMVQSDTYDARSCKCAMPKIRVNYSTGG